MAKKIKREIKPSKVIKEKKPTIKLKDYQKNLITFGIVFVLLLIVFSPMAFQGMRPGGVDVIGSKGSSHQRIEFQKKTGETVYWNSPVFSGMPIYHRIGGKAFSFDTILSKFFSKILYVNIWIYLIGFIGMFFLLKFFNLNYWLAVFGGLAFIFIPHYMSLLSIGHFAKFRPIMYIPLVTFFFLSFLNKKNIIFPATESRRHRVRFFNVIFPLCSLCLCGSFVGFIFAFSVQIRTQHYQILFYQILILLFTGLYYLIKMLKEKQIKTAGLKLILIVAASALIILMVAQPLFVTGEYTPYSIRGGTGEKGSTGLELDYATSWSFHPTEILTWLMPRFFGGTSGEVYTGNKVEQLKGRQIPGYWGHMPFTQAYDYIGVVLLFLALLGLILNFRNGFIKTLFALFILSLLLSFGRHFPLIYNLFFNNIPYFNKFRVPAMISVIMQIIIVIFAGFGLKSLMENGEGKTEKGKRKSEPIPILHPPSSILHPPYSILRPPSSILHLKIIIGIAIFLIILGLIPQIFGNSFSLEKIGEKAQYEPQVISLFKSARLDMMQTDGLRLILFTILTATIILLFVNKKIKPNIFFLGIITLLLVDQIPYVKKAEGELNNPVQMEKEYFAKSSTDKVILQDTTYYRVFPITENPFNTNDWSYYHNSIGGYSAAKLRIYQDIIENCLYKGKNPQLPINWNILKMLNTKYIISTSQLPTENLKPYYYDKQKKYLIYKTEINAKPAWFVDRIEIIPDTCREERFAALNNPNFNPFHTAILEKELEVSAKGGSFGEIQSPDSSYVKVQEASFNKMQYKIYTDKPTLFVTSEIYYPRGWKCFVDGKETEIYKTNHILRSVYIDSPGEHEILFKFVPDTFIKYYHISMIGHVIAYLLLIAAAVFTIKWRTEKRKTEDGRTDEKN